MNKKKLMRSGIALALSISMASGITLSTPAVAEASTGNITVLSSAVLRRPLR